MKSLRPLAEERWLKLFFPILLRALLYSMGFVVATGCLHAVGIGVGLIHRWPWGQRLLRAAGAVIAVAGVFFMWRAIA